MNDHKKYLLILGDIIILYFSLWITLIIRYQTNYTAELLAMHLWPFTVVFAFWLIIFYIEDLYEISYHLDNATLLVKLSRSILIGSAFAVVFFYLGQNRLFSIRPQTVLLINSVLAGLLIHLWHVIFITFTKSPKIANGLVIIGFNQLTKEIINDLKEKPQLGYQLRTIMIEPSYESEIPENLKSITIRDHFDNLKSICQEKKINTIISTIHPRQDAELSKNLFKCIPLKINFFDVANFYERITGKIPVNTIEQIWFLENLVESNKKFYEKIKRGFDILFSLSLLILSAPFVPLVALLIKLDSKGPIFFTQTRTGRDGKNFKAIKFRTMIENAEISGPQWATKNDARVTKVGKFLRKTRIDEIPQLFNVLRGEMSIIGPRPERPEFIDQLQNDIPFYKERLLIRPGLTGWAQVVGPAYGGSKEESLEKLQYDLYYIKNRSIALDLSIILKTIRTVLGSRGQ